MKGELNGGVSQKFDYEGNVIKNSFTFAGDSLVFSYVFLSF